MRFCVYTALIGSYERLNEQPVAKDSAVDFVCLTDDPALRSESWRLDVRAPVFAMDPIRSQRDLKLRPHVHLPAYDASIYIDNAVVLRETPEAIVARYLGSSPFALFEHSFRDTVLDEFLEVSRLGYDDQNRIFEQLNHYALSDPSLLEEKPYWGAILLRDHRDEGVRRMLEIWASHVNRYSRRDQLSVNMAFGQAGLRPNAIRESNFTSWFHSWPQVVDRVHDRGMRHPGVSLAPPVAHLRRAEASLRAATEDLERRRQEVAALRAEGEGARAERAVLEERLRALGEALARTSHSVAGGNDRTAAVGGQTNEAFPAETERLVAEVERLSAARASAQREAERLRRQLDAATDSTSWRVAHPVRRILSRSPALVGFARRSAKVLGWALAFGRPGGLRRRPAVGAERSGRSNGRGSTAD